jgi:hypothetical protein
MRILRCLLVGVVLGFVAAWLWMRRHDETAVDNLSPTTRMPAYQDDLTEVVGIGPAYARALNSIGIQSFEQLARQDADALAARLTTVRVSAARIRRDRWIEQAGERSQRRPLTWSGNDNGRSTKIGYTE